MSFTKYKVFPPAKKGYYEIGAVKGKNRKNETCIITLVDRKIKCRKIPF